MESRSGVARAVLVPYVVSRVIVLATLAVMRHIFTTTHAHTPAPLRDGLLGWDASWYRDIAKGGYDAVDRSGLRFFPLVPLLARAVGWFPGVSTGAGLLVVANLSALAAGFVVWRLVWAERHDADLARRSVWIAYLAPLAFVLVMGYAEATLMLCGAVALFALRSRRWWIAAIAGYLAGLARPVGVLLTVPALVEVLRNRDRLRPAELVGRLAAVGAPGLGALTFLVWARGRTHDLLAPLRAQENERLRGKWVDPFRGFGHAVREALHGGHLSAAVHVVTAVVIVVLVVVLARRWPLSFTLYAVATLVVGLSTRNLDSLERYTLSTVPFVLAAADLVTTEARERLVLTLLAASLVLASALAFTGVMVP